MPNIQYPEGYIPGTDVNDYCAIHGYEPIPDVYYKVCYECHHCFVTAEELLECNNDIIKYVAEKDGVTYQLETDPENICICPVCAHDF